MNNTIDETIYITFEYGGTTHKANMKQIEVCTQYEADISSARLVSKIVSPTHPDFKSLQRRVYNLFLPYVPTTEES